ncbi:helix-turn-helix domain-containing protein [Pannonibacter sp. Q-1]|uniref:helix-turn-helix domain-containing protein n=1 Tax=Pannonibacter TaxID=227873 RepID=UPI000F01412D|nr:helix-turn-helix domain-containing protein [Pannonibacter phragmitetus]
MSCIEDINADNPHLGDSLDSLLEEDGLLEEVTAVAIKRTLALQLLHAMKTQKITKSEMARRMRTSASQLERILDPSNDRVQLDTLLKAAAAVGRKLTFSLT